MLGATWVKPLMGAIAVLTFITVGLFVWGQASKQRAAVTAALLDQANTILVDEREKNQLMREQLIRVQRDYEQLKEGLDNALEKDSDWGNTPVPKPVADVLCDKARCNTM